MGLEKCIHGFENMSSHKMTRFWRSWYTFYEDPLMEEPEYEHYKKGTLRKCLEKNNARDSEKQGKLKLMPITETYSLEDV